MPVWLFDVKFFGLHLRCMLATLLSHLLHEVSSQNSSQILFFLKRSSTTAFTAFGVSCIWSSVHEPDGLVRIAHRLVVSQVSIVTGRKHQIRVHLAQQGHPVVNDSRRKALG